MKIRFQKMSSIFLGPIFTNIQVCKTKLIFPHFYTFSWGEILQLPPPPKKKKNETKKKQRRKKNEYKVNIPKQF